MVESYTDEELLELRNEYVHACCYRMNHGTEGDHNDSRILISLPDKKLTVRVWYDGEVDVIDHDRLSSTELTTMKYAENHNFALNKSSYILASQKTLEHVVGLIKDLNNKVTWGE